MAKCGSKPREPTRRELRQLWREAANAKAHTIPGQHVHPSQLPSLTLVVTSRRLLPRSKKAGGRRRPIEVPDLLSPSKAKKIKDDFKANKKNDGGPPHSPKRRAPSPDVFSLLDEFQNRFKDNTIRIQATVEKIEARSVVLPPTRGLSKLDDTLTAGKLEETTPAIISGVLESISNAFPATHSPSSTKRSRALEDPFTYESTAPSTSIREHFRPLILRTGANLLLDSLSDSCTRPHGSTELSILQSPTSTRALSSTGCTLIRTSSFPARMLSTTGSRHGSSYLTAAQGMVRHDDTFLPRAVPTKLSLVAGRTGVQMAATPNTSAAHNPIARVEKHPDHSVDASVSSSRLPRGNVNDREDDMDKHRSILNRATNNSQGHKPWTLSNVSSYDITGTRHGFTQAAPLMAAASFKSKIEHVWDDYRSPGTSPNDFLSNSQSPGAVADVVSATQPKLLSRNDAGSIPVFASRHIMSSPRGPPELTSLIRRTHHLPTSQHENSNPWNGTIQSRSPFLHANDPALSSTDVDRLSTHVHLMDGRRAHGSAVQRISLLPFGTPSSTELAFPGSNLGSNLGTFSRESVLPAIPVDDDLTPSAMPQGPVGVSRSTRRATLLRTLNLEWLAGEESGALDIESGGDLLPVIDVDASSEQRQQNDDIQVRDKHSTVVNKVNAAFGKIKHLFSPWRIIHAVYQRS